MQYQSECLEALKSVANIRKPFEKVFMDAMKLFMAIPGRINFLQMGRYGKFSEQTYRNHFVNESFDWFSFNEHLVKEHLPGKRKAIGVDPSYIPKSGKKTPWLGYFWSGCSGEYKRGLEIMGIGVIDVDNRECMTLGSVQSPDTKTLDNMDKSLVDWYAGYLVSRREQIHRISNIVVADAFFSKSTFITPMCNSGFHIISRFRNDAVLFYPTAENRPGGEDVPSCMTAPWTSRGLTPPDVRNTKSTNGSSTSRQTKANRHLMSWNITGLASNWSSASGTASSTPESQTASPPTSESWLSTSTHRLRQSISQRPHAKGWEYRIPSHLASQ